MCMKTPFKSKGDYEYAMRKLGECVGDVVTGPNVRRATAYISPTFIMKATAQRRYRKNEPSCTVLVTVGAPNFVERRFVRLCKKSGYVFPLNQIHWKLWPKK